MTKRHKLLLFDIDGTLVIYKDKFPHRLFEGMIEAFFDKKISLANYRFSGKTDKAIIADMVEEQTSPESFNLLPNVTELLQKLSADKNITLALLTGNLPRCAEIKLQHFDLMKYFSFGVYGVESINRNDLGPIALKKFADHHNGKSLSELDPIVIGDTIPDILCAKHINAKSIITLTGRT